MALAAEPVFMDGRTMKGWISDAAAKDLTLWIDLAKAFNRTRPPEDASRRSRKA